MERGVIASPGIIKPIPKGFQMQRSISPEEIRFYLMYWDRVVIPGNNLVYIGIPEEEEELVKCSAVERPRVTFQGTFQGDQITQAIFACQDIIARALMKERSFDWVIHQFGDDLAISENFSIKNNHTIRVDLLNALPVPSSETGVAEILEFKQRRADELSELHNSIDALYLEILQSPDPELTSKKVVKEFQNSVDCLNRVFLERFSHAHKYDLSVELNLNGKDIMLGAVSGAIFDFFSHNPLNIPISSIIGGLISTLKVSAKSTHTFTPASTNSKLAYLSRARKENLLPR